MSRSSGASLVQKTITGTSTIMENVNIRTEAHRELVVYFCLDVWEGMSDKKTMDIFAPRITQLEPGKHYRAKVRTVIQQGSGQIAVNYHPALELILMIDKPVLTIPNDRVELHWENAKTFKHEFDLIVLEDIPSSQIELRLHYRKLPYAYFEEEPVACCRLQLAGNYNPIEQHLLDPCPVNLVVERPSKTAILHVQDGLEKDKIKLTCFGHYADHNISTIPFVPPKVRLADFIEAQTDPETVLAEIRAFSDDTANLQIQFESTSEYGRKRNLTLMGWIDLLYKRLGEAINLVICDHTDTEIPWEMVEIETGKYLGAIVPVARWLPIPISAKEGIRKLELNSEYHLGRVIAYLDKSELADAIAEQQMIASFDAEFHPNIDHFHNRLNQSLSEIGLVYMACHGMFAPHDINNIAYGSRNNPGNRLIPLHLEIRETQESTRPVVFVNACHSGRIIRREDGWRLHGLPIVMLKRVASGYIGTLGPVGSKYASQVIHYILDTMRANPEGIEPVQLLRQLRARAVQRYNANKKSQENQLQFIYTFMYVYYGNPLTHLRLLLARTTGSGDG